MSALPALLVTLLAGAQASDNTGTIEGLVVNASRGDQAVAAAEVVLQVQIDGQFQAVEQTVSDDAGKFRFESLPVGLDVVYLPGANRDGVHYPGRRIELTSRRPNAYLTLAVRDGISEPNPLIVRQHEIVIGREPGVLHVVEAMLIDNPGQTTFIGQSGSEDTPVTLTLGIPLDFARLTFEEEFFGRQFVVSNGAVVSSLPWTPGQRWLRYTYSIPNHDAARVLSRKLDLPTEAVRVRVRDVSPEEVTCNLADAATAAANQVEFGNGGKRLPTGYDIQVTLGNLPLPWMHYARWSALLILVGFMAVAAAFVARRRAEDGRTTAFEAGEQTGGDAQHHGPHPGQTAQRSRRRRRTSVGK